MLHWAPGSYLALNTKKSSFLGSDVRGTAGHRFPRWLEESVRDEAAAGNRKTRTLWRKIEAARANADKGRGTL